MKYLFQSFTLISLNLKGGGPPEFSTNISVVLYFDINLLTEEILEVSISFLEQEIVFIFSSFKCFEISFPIPLLPPSIIAFLFLISLEKIFILPIIFI